jgi:phosphatidylinositol alpha-1,6-mannosyltransferase
MNTLRRMAMRILLLTHEYPPFPGGVATYCAEIANAAQDLGHDVTVVAPDYGEVREPHPCPGVRVMRFRGGVYDRRALAHNLLRTVRVLRDVPHDIVHAADWPCVMALGFVNRFGKARFAATVHGTDVIGPLVGRQARLLGGRNMLLRAERVYANSGYTRSLLASSGLAVDPARVVVTPLGVNRFWFDPAGSADRLLSDLGVAPDRRIVLTVGRLDERKGHRLVLRALASLPAGLKAGIAYVIAGKEGDPGYVAELRALAARSGVQVVFAGVVPRDDLRRLYAAADVLCMPGEPHPRKVEGFGLVYLEAAAQGLPSIATDLAAIPEVVKHGSTGIIVPQGDECALAQALSMLVSSPDEVRRLGQSARDWAHGFTWRACAERTYGCLESREGNAATTIGTTGRATTLGVSAP